jgi:hypothetical protein
VFLFSPRRPPGAADRAAALPRRLFLKVKLIKLVEVAELIKLEEILNSLVDCRSARGATAGRLPGRDLPRRRGTGGPLAPGS